jgi:hypothetical protein
MHFSAQITRLPFWERYPACFLRARFASTLFGLPDVARKICRPFYIDLSSARPHRGGSVPSITPPIRLLAWVTEVPLSWTSLLPLSLYLCRLGNETRKLVGSSILRVLRYGYPHPLLLVGDGNLRHPDHRDLGGTEPLPQLHRLQQQQQQHT